MVVSVILEKRVTEERVTPIPPEWRFVAEQMLEPHYKRELTEVQFAEQSGVTQAHISALD